MLTKLSPIKSVTIPNRGSLPVEVNFDKLDFSKGQRYYLQINSNIIWKAHLGILYNPELIEFNPTYVVIYNIGDVPIELQQGIELIEVYVIHTSGDLDSPKSKNSKEGQKWFSWFRRIFTRNNSDTKPFSFVD